MSHRNPICITTFDLQAAKDFSYKISAELEMLYHLIFCDFELFLE